MPAHDPAERTLIARLAAFEKARQTKDPSATTRAARKGLDEKFLREADPHGVLDPMERARRAEIGRKAFYTRLALKSHQARKARRLADRLAAEVEDALTGDAA
jgi:hypothetical protein